MKKKKLKKIAKLIFEEINSIKKSDFTGEKTEYVSYDSEVSKKTTELITKLLDYNEGIAINFNSESFNISAPDITNIKKSIKKNTIYNDDNYLDIYVVKDKGFSINLAYSKRTNYEDKNMYDQLVDKISDRVLQNNRENFVDIWNRVMKDSGIIRDNNLEQLFDE